MKLNEIITDKNIPDTVVLSLIPKAFQLEDFRRHVGWKRSANFSDVGTGKSLVSYLWIADKLYSGKGVIVVMPPPLITQYVRNFDVISEHPFTFTVLEKNKHKREEILQEWEESGTYPDVLFMSYQLFVKYAKRLRYVTKYKALVADEAHIMANASTTYFQAVFMNLFSNDMDFLEMTATPCPTELRSAYGHIRLRSPQAYTDLAHFDRVHTVWQQGEAGSRIKIVASYKELPLLYDNLNRYAVRRKADEVLSLKQPTEINHHVCLSDGHYELYQQLLLERMLEFGDDLLVAKNQQALRQMALQIVTNVGDYTKKPIEDEPLDNLKEILDNTPGKFAVFCNFRATIRRLDKTFRARNPALIYGDSDVQKNVDKFLNDPTCTVAFLNYKSGGAGFNLQSACHNVIFYEATGSPGDLTQALGRVQRQGQEHPVIAWKFRYGLTSSHKLFQKAFGRAKDIATVMGDNAHTVDELKTSLGICK